MARRSTTSSSPVYTRTYAAKRIIELSLHAEALKTDSASRAAIRHAAMKLRSLLHTGLDHADSECPLATVWRAGDYISALACRHDYTADSTQAVQYIEVLVGVLRDAVFALDRSDFGCRRWQYTLWKKVFQDSRPVLVSRLREQGKALGRDEEE